MRKDKFGKKLKSEPFLMLLDHWNQKNTLTKVYKSRGTITCLNYGPYDNGHILIGMSTGDFIALDAINLTKITQVKISNASPITNIAIEPTQMVMISDRDTQNVTAVSFIETLQKYIYIDLGHGKFATVIAPNQNSKARKARSKSRKRNASQA